MEEKYSTMYIILKILGATSMLMAFLLLLVPLYSIPLFIISFFMFYVAYEVFPPLNGKRLLDGKELVVVND